MKAKEKEILHEALTEALQFADDMETNAMRAGVLVGRIFYIRQLLDSFPVEEPLFKAEEETQAKGEI